jgi:hypothetical protein
MKKATCKEDCGSTRTKLYKDHEYYYESTQNFENIDDSLFVFIYGDITDKYNTRVLMSRLSFSELFYTSKELRKIKLNKLKNKL